MRVKEKKPIKGYGYFPNETAEIPYAEALKFVESGLVIIIPETEGANDNPLPEDMPCRAALFKNGFETVEQILSAKESLSEIKGISKKSAESIIKFCEENEN